ncbi:MAG: magnesium chelatase [Acidobacteria bacterium]|nr:magnesium chelatase [Acidobacteriota bacterium]
MKSEPKTLGELRQSEFSEENYKLRSVKDEMRQNLIRHLEQSDALFPGIVGFDDTVIPQVVNAVLSRHNFILLGLRGQAKSRILRALASLLDERLPVLAGCEINDNPYAPICRACRLLLEEKGDAAPVAFLTREFRYVEKLATPDVTIADMIGDIDPIKAARGGHQLSDELNIHFGLLPRANRGIFAINELPDLAGKIQVGLFNIMQEGDVQIKGFPIRLPLDVALVFTANPEDYTSRGKIITPLKDRIGSEIRTHYPADLDEGIAITQQEAWLARDGRRLVVPGFIREVVEQIAFLARTDKKIDKRSGVSQRMPISCIENVASNAERRAIRNKENVGVPRILDLYGALPAMTGKFELEYEGELKGADTVARELIRGAIGKVFKKHYDSVDLQQVVQWFELGGSLKLSESMPAAEVLTALRKIQGLVEKTAALGIRPKDKNHAALVVSAAEFILEGLYAQRRISRSEERGFIVGERKQTPALQEEFRPHRRPYN